MNSMFEILLIAILASASCALVGNFLVLRRLSMMTDAISHTVLLGIVLAFMIVGSLTSPFLMLGAALMGLITVWIIESLIKSRTMSEDAAVGLVFPFFFSIAVIIICLHAANVQLDTDSVLLGELAFAPFDRWYIDNIDLGPKGIYISLSMLAINLFFITLCYKELTMATFDPIFCSLQGFSLGLIHYGLMSLISLTAVTSFQTIGSILLIAFMVTPALISSLWTKTLKARLILSILIGAISSGLGVLLAIYYNTSLAGMMVVVLVIALILSIAIKQLQKNINRKAA